MRVAGNSRTDQLILSLFSAKQSLLEGKLISTSYRVYDEKEGKITAKLCMYHSKLFLEDQREVPNIKLRKVATTPPLCYEQKT